MKNPHKIVAIAIGLFLTAGISAEAMAESPGYTSDYRSHQVAGKAGYARNRHVRQHRGFKRTGHYSHRKYRTPVRRYVRAHHAPRAHRSYHYARHHRYSRYHRDVNVGAVVAGLVVGGLVYEILRNDHDQDEVYYEDH